MSIVETIATAQNAVQFIDQRSTIKDIKNLSHDRLLNLHNSLSTEKSINELSIDKQFIMYSVESELLAYLCQLEKNRSKTTDENNTYKRSTRYNKIVTQFKSDTQTVVEKFGDLLNDAYRVNNETRTMQQDISKKVIKNIRAIKGMLVLFLLLVLTDFIMRVIS